MFLLLAAFTKENLTENPLGFHFYKHLDNVKHWRGGGRKGNELGFGWHILLCQQKLLAAMLCLLPVQKLRKRNNVCEETLS